MEFSPLLRAFFERDTLDVARDLLGMAVVREIDGQQLVGAIVETEAYVGHSDRASHASRGLTDRTRMMFGEAGHAYVYMVYGMHHCLNVVTDRPGYPAAVLIRALQPFGRELGPMNGPGRLSRALAIDRALNGHDLTRRGPLYMAEPRLLPASPFGTSCRVGVEYAGDWAAMPWRFYLEGNSHLSRVGTPNADPPRRHSSR